MNKKLLYFFKNYSIIFLIIILLSCLIILYKYSKQNIVNEGLNKNNIIFGQSCSLTKKNINISRRYSFGYILAFQKINREGGINNRNLELIIYDDQYNSDIALNNVQILIGYFNVFGIIGSVGTNTSIAIQNYLVNKKIPFIEPLTGCNLLRNEFNEYIIHTRTSYYNEVKVILDFLKKENKKKISILYQNDNFGLSTLNDINLLLSYKEYINYFSIISKGSYESTDLIINKGISDILNVKDIYNTNEVNKSQNIKNIEAIILITTYEKASIAIDYFKILKPELYIFMISFSSLDEIRENLMSLQDKYTQNIYLTNVLPDVNKTNPKLIDEIKNEIKIYYGKKEHSEYYDNIKSNYISTTLLEGYLNGLFIINVLKNIKNNDYSRQNFIDEIYKKSIFNIEGLTYGPFYKNTVCKEKKIDSKNCPCNVGLKSIYLNKYDSKLKDFVYVYELKNLDCNKII